MRKKLLFPCANLCSRGEDANDINSKYYRCLCNCFHVSTCTKVLLAMHSVLAFVILKMFQPFAVDWYPVPATIIFCAILGVVLKRYVLMWPIVICAGILFCLSLIFAVVLLPFVLNDFGFFTTTTFELFYFHLDWMFELYVHFFFEDQSNKDISKYFETHKGYVYIFFTIVQILLIFLAIFSYWQLDTIARCTLYLKKKYPAKKISIPREKITIPQIIISDTEMSESPKIVENDVPV